MFKHASKEVRMYDHALDGDISEKNCKVVEAMTNFIQDSSRTLRIVIRDDRPYEHANIFKVLSQLSCERTNLEIRKATPEFKQEMTNIYNKDINFAVGDLMSFRMEKVDSDAASSPRGAFCSFNRPDYAKKLASVFDKHFSSCSVIQFS